MKWDRFWAAISAGFFFYLFPWVASAAGLVPCGTTGNVSPSDPLYSTLATTCQACNLVELIQNLINFTIGVSIPIAMLLFVYAGWLYVSSNENTGKISRARGIFKNVIIGFVIMLSAYLVVNTVLHAILDPKFSDGWNTVKCTNTPREREKNISDLLGVILGTGNGGISSGGSGTATCPPGSSLKPASPEDATMVCVDDSTGKTVSPTYTGGVPAGFASCDAYGLTQLQTCIAAKESSCNPNIGSGVDFGSDHNAVSWGLFQINLSANNIQCSNVNNGQVLNCKAAFGGGAYTGSNHSTYVANAVLYQQCVAAAQDVNCNKQMMNQIYSAGGLKNWGTDAQNSCSGL